MVTSKICKTLLPCLMALVLVLGMFPDCRAFADEEVTEEGTPQEQVTSDPALEGDEPTEPDIVDEPEPEPVQEEPVVETVEEGTDEPVEVVEETPEQPMEEVPVEEGQPLVVEEDSIGDESADATSEEDEVLVAMSEEDEVEEVEPDKDSESEDEEEEEVLTTQAEAKASVKYRGHVQNIGWQSYVKDGAVAGTSGRSLRVEALQISVDSKVKGSITYCAHVQNIGWQSYVKDGAVAGTSGRSLRVEALKIQLTGDLAKKFDVYYRVHVQDFGWLDWASNGAPAGSEGLSKRVEAVQVKLVKKGGKAPGATADTFRQNMISYSTHVQNIGWQSAAKDGQIAGTTGRSLRVEAVTMQLASGISGGISYSAHVQNVGWQTFASNGGVAGTTGRSLRVEALKVQLTGAAANNYDVYYRVHAQDYGWLDWACNGAPAGTEGMSKRVEAVQVRLVPKGGAAPGSTAKPYATPSVSYRMYERGVGWTGWSSNGQTAGTTGQSLATEAFALKVSDLGVSGSVRYSAHVQNVGWTDEVGQGKFAGRAGKSLRLEAVTMRLTGKASSTYDLYYRVHSANYGWLDWACNGAPAGTEGYGKAIEAMEVQLVRKGGAAPGATARPYVTKTSSSAGGTSTATLNLTLDEMTSLQMGYANGSGYATVKSLLNPASFKPGSSDYYQFANLSGYSGLTAAQIDKYIASTPNGRTGKLKGTGLAFVAASKKYGVNECYLLSHAIWETGWGTSALANGSSGYYNFFGIGAYDGGAYRYGSQAAQYYGWNTPEKAIMGGAEFISTNYLNRQTYPQNTIYGMKWDYLYASATGTRGYHQYASDPNWPTSISGMMSHCYNYCGVTPKLSYIVPRYKS